MNEWISVKERMPYKQPLGFKTYIVASLYHSKKEYHVGAYNFHNGNFTEYDGEIISMDDGYWEITHWMNLPEPPNETRRSSLFARIIKAIKRAWG